MELPVACSLADTELRDRRETIIRKIAANMSGSDELENGFDYRFPIVDGTLIELAELISLMDPKQIVRTGYDKVSHAYRSESYDYEHSEYRPFLEWLEPRLAPGSRVLDLGCGCGVPVSSRLAREHRVTGVDISPVQIERARSLVPDATFILGDMTGAGFADESFDAIIAFYSIIHIPLAEQPALLAAIARWLRPSGYLLASVGHGAWTGTEPDWCNVEGATMYWSHADTASYRGWLVDQGFEILEDAFLPEGSGGHTMILCRKM